MATKRAEKQKTITLSGSTKMVTEFFEYSVNSILYQRGLYPDEDFKPVKKYGLTLLTTTDTGVETYLQTVMKQVQAWILAGSLSRLVMAVISKETRETLEMWTFDIEAEDAPGKENAAPQGAPTKSEKSTEQIQKDIQQIIRQITSCVTFLPHLEEKCTFNLLVYADKDAPVPDEWRDSHPHMIKGNAEQVKLRGFSTNRHKVDTMVAYRLGADL